jgi:heme exporter protein C
METRMPMAPRRRDHAQLAGLALIALALPTLATGSYLGLFRAPPEHFMGEVSRILYVHVPTAWMALVALTVAFVSAVGFLLTRRWFWDALLEASVEVGVVLAFLLCVQGAIWAKPTWGVWWDWDPRLTTVAVMLFAFLGVVALRRFVEDPVKRAAWAATATIVSFADVPIVYYSVRWWNSLHQAQSSPETMDAAMVLPLRINAFGMLFLVAGLVVLRARLTSMKLRDELAPPAPEPLLQPNARPANASATGGRP